MKAIEQSFLVVLFIMLFKVALTLESVDAILKCACDRSDEPFPWHRLLCYTMRL